MTRLILTVGHSTHPLETFLRILESHGVTHLVDVRRYPGSRRYPHFGRDVLAAALARVHSAYTHLPELGGRRLPRQDSANIGLRHEAFRGYADHMATAEFEDGIQRLLAIGAQGRTAVMCAEGPWRRCHRRLLADDLAARGVSVVHLLDDRRREPHVVLAPGVIAGGRVRYPATPLFSTEEDT